MPPKLGLRDGARVSCPHGDDNLLGFVERVNKRTIRVLFDGEKKSRSIDKKPGYYKVIAGGKKPVAKVRKAPQPPPHKKSGPEKEAERASLAAAAGGGRRRDRRRGREAELEILCPDCEGPTTDQQAGIERICGKCDANLVAGERIHTCKDGNCDEDICHFCATGQQRPKKKKKASMVEGDSGSDSDGAEALEQVVPAPDQRGAAFDGVPKERKGETVQERRTREKAEVTARQKQRIINAKSKGLRPILKEAAMTELNKDSSYPWLVKIPSASFGGVMTPYIDDDGYGIRFYEAVDINACDTSGLRRSFRRFQEVHLKDGVLERLGFGDYRGNSKFVVQWASLEFEDSKPVGEARVWVSFWEHINKKVNKITNACLMLSNADIDAGSTFVHPFKAEDTHLVAHTRRGWSLTLLEHLKTLKRKPQAAAPETGEDVAKVIVEQDVIPIDEDESASVRALQISADAKRARELKAAEHNTRFKFKNSEAGKEVEAQKRADEQKEADARKLAEHGTLVAELASTKQNLKGQHTKRCFAFFLHAPLLMFDLACCRRCPNGEEYGAVGEKKAGGSQHRLACRTERSQDIKVEAAANIEENA